MCGWVHAGPFNFEAAKSKENLPTLHINPYSWSKVGLAKNVTLQINIATLVK